MRSRSFCAERDEKQGRRASLGDYCKPSGVWLDTMICRNMWTISKSKASVKTEKLELIDVLSDELVAYKDIPRVSERSRQVQDSTAFAAIEEAYEDLKSDLISAASVAL